MRWAEVDLVKRVWTIPRERTKSDRAHTVHLSELAAEILVALPRMGDLVFPSRAGHPVASFAKPKQRLDAAMSKQAEAQIDAWVLHDLRRTATTIMADWKSYPTWRTRSSTTRPVRSGALPPSTTDLSTSPSARPRWRRWGASSRTWCGRRTSCRSVIGHKSDGRRRMGFVGGRRRVGGRSLPAIGGGGAGRVRRRNPLGPGPARCSPRDVTRTDTSIILAGLRLATVARSSGKFRRSPMADRPAARPPGYCAASQGAEASYDG